MKEYDVYTDRRNRWSAYHLRTCSCRLRKDDYETFRRSCALKGYTAHHVLRILVAAYLAAEEESISDHLERDLREEARRRYIRLIFK